MILSLKILRGVNLVAMDYNVTTTNNSDPYCQVYVNDNKVGWTATQYSTVNPIWGGPSSTFQIKGGGGTKISIKIFDYDALKADDPMGQVTFYAQDMLNKTTAEGYPNIWKTVSPPKGYENVHCGKIQIRLLPVSEFESPPGRMPLQFSAGPELAGISTAELQERIASAKSPVFLHVYDVGEDKRIHALNQVLPVTGAGGIFHGAIEVYGREYSFGYSKSPHVCGVFACKPMSCPTHTYQRSLYLGDCELSDMQVKSIRRIQRPDWMANTYNLFRKNCCNFSNEFAIELGVGAIPGWVYNLAKLGAYVDTKLRGVKVVGGKPEPRDPVSRDDEVEQHYNLIEDTAFTNVMAIRLQRSFRAKNGTKLGFGSRGKLILIVKVSCI